MCPKLSKQTDAARDHALEQIGVFEDNLLVISEKLDAKALHKMRIAFKQLDAIYWFMAGAGEKGARRSNHFRRMRTLFKLAGKFRDQLNYREMAVEWEIPVSREPDPAVRLKLEKFLAKWNPEWLKRASKKCKSFFENEPAEIGKRIKKYRERLEKKLRHSIEGEVIDLHEIRIRAKRLLYFTEAIQEEEHDFHALLDAAANALGEWHDLYLFEIKALSDRNRDIPEALYTRISQELEQAEFKARSAVSRIFG